MQKVYTKVRAAGFTLIELLVVLAIISVITFLLLIQQSKFDSATVLRSLAYNVALSVRQAQVYGVSVQGQNTLGSGIPVFAQAYGLYFNPATSPNSYVLFADANNDLQRASDGSEDVSKFKINSAYTLSEVCAITGDGTRRCSGSDDSGGAGSIGALTILFKRPNPDAIFSVSPAISGDVYTNVYIKIQSANGDKRGIRVYITGQVSVDQIGQSI